MRARYVLPSLCLFLATAASVVHAGDARADSASVMLARDAMAPLDRLGLRIRVPGDGWFLEIPPEDDGRSETLEHDDDSSTTELALWLAWSKASCSTLLAIGGELQWAPAWLPAGYQRSIAVNRKGIDMACAETPRGSLLVGIAVRSMNDGSPRALSERDKARTNQVLAELVAAARQ